VVVVVAQRRSAPEVQPLAQRDALPRSVRSPLAKASVPAASRLQLAGPGQAQEKAEAVLPEAVPVPLVVVVVVVAERCEPRAVRPLTHCCHRYSNL